MTTNKPEVFEVYRTRQGTLENVVLLADYEALQTEYEKLRKDAELKHAALEREVERLKQQQFTDLCNSADVKRLISVVAFPDNYADQNFSEMAKRVLAKMEQNDKALAGGRRDEELGN